MKRSLFAAIIFGLTAATLFAQAPKGAKGKKAARANAAQGQARRTLEQRVKALEDKDAILKVMYAYAYTVDFGKDTDRKSTRLNSSHIPLSRMPSSA